MIVRLHSSIHSCRTYDGILSTRTLTSQRGRPSEVQGNRILTSFSCSMRLVSLLVPEIRGAARLNRLEIVSGSRCRTMSAGAGFESSLKEVLELLGRLVVVDSIIEPLSDGSASDPLGNPRAWYGKLRLLALVKGHRLANSGDTSYLGPEPRPYHLSGRA